MSKFDLANVRYVHANEGDHRFTVAYVRNEHFLLFGVAIVNPKDEYVKSIGRDVSTERLKKVVNYFDVTLENVTVSGASFCAFPSDLGGYTDVSAFVELSQLDNVIADHVKLSMMDFKHAFLSAVLVRVVEANAPFAY